MPIKLNEKERKILAMAHYNPDGILPDDCVKFYKTPHHIKNVLRYLKENGVLQLLANGRFIITDEGRDLLGVQSHAYKKLNEFA